MLDEGTPTRDAAAIAKGFEDLAARYTVVPDADSSTLLVVALTKVRSSSLARLFLLGNAIACAGLVLDARPDDAPGGAGASHDATDSSKARRLVLGATAGAGQVMFLQGVALGGMARYARGDRSTLWAKVER